MEEAVAPDVDPVYFSHPAQALISVFEKKEAPNHEPKITVNRFVSEIANWYEKLRNAMDYRDEEVVLRASIERILKRRLSMSRTADPVQVSKSVAESLLKELVWAHYFPNGTMPESMIHKTSETIALYLRFRKGVKSRYILRDNIVNKWFYQLLSSHLAKLLRPQLHKNMMSNFMYFVMKDAVKIADDTDDVKNVQAFLAVRRAFGKDDTAFLRFALFEQIFGQLSEHTLEHTVHGFKKGYQEIKAQLRYKLKEKIYQYIKKQTPVFVVLEDVLESQKGKIKETFGNAEEFKKVVYEACEKRYKGIASKVRFAILKSVIFLLVTKAIFALLIEGSYENYAYGHVQWLSIWINICIPPLLLIIVSLFITQPKQDNSERILEKIKIVLTEEEPMITHLFVVAKKTKKRVMDYIFSVLWLFAFFVSFGTMSDILTRIHFNPVSQAVFLFFIAVVSFLAYGINSTAHQYMVDPKPGLFTPFIDFLFIPIVRVGRWFTDGISSINVIVFIFDYVIEIPFKAVFGFFDQLFGYLHTKREELE